ncbi:unnamed protein product [Alopecurus aequalis]
MARLCFFPALVVQLLLLIAGVAGSGRRTSNSPLQFLQQHPDDAVGTRWAVLVAGSSGYENYRHQASWQCHVLTLYRGLCNSFKSNYVATNSVCDQADVCHAYQILKKGGLKDENIIVFMYDDIAYNPENPRRGVIINSPTGRDVYAGVPKDYTGADVNVNNFLAVLLGNRSAITGGSRKAVNSRRDDHIFVFFSDHGGEGILCMPSELLYANDLVNTLKKKHAAGTYKSLVFYLEACESGSIFEGLLPANISVYATTASNAVESSYATYCPGEAPAEYTTCLGDLYSVAWMEDTEAHDRRTESLKQQYDAVKARTSALSHVMQYGAVMLNFLKLDVYMGAAASKSGRTLKDLSAGAVSQRDADLLHFWHKYQRSAEGSSEKSEAQKQLAEELARRSRLDNTVEMIGGRLFGSEEGPRVLNAARPVGQALVDDWDCLKSMVLSFEEQCGALGQYGLKHTRAFANMCNAGIGAETMSKLASQACSSTFVY